jgi:hypothetical protein
MTRILTIAAVVIVLLGLAVGGYFWWEARQQASLTVGETPVTNPFGSNGTDVQPSTGTTTSTDTSGSAVQVSPKLVQITKNAAAAGLSVSRVVIPPPPGSASTTASTSDTEVRYADRASGNIYAYDIHQAKSTRLSNRTIPGAAQASWLADGSIAFLRFITADASQNQSVNTYALPASGVGGYALSPGLAQVVAIGSSSVLTLSSTNNGSTAVLSNAAGANPRTVLSSPLAQIKIFWTTAGIVSETLPSASTGGYAFTTDKSGNQTLVAGPLNGLSILPNRAGTKAIISYVSGKTLKLAQLDFATAHSRLCRSRRSQKNASGHRMTTTHTAAYRFLFLRAHFRMIGIKARFNSPTAFGK